MNIQHATAKIRVGQLGIVPAAHVSPLRITFHLTRGHIVEGDTETFNDAINFIGTVMVSTTPTEFADWDFAFLQFQEIEFLGIFYAGAKRDDGQIVLLPHQSPALSDNLHLDSEPDFDPFTHGFDASLSGGKVTAISGDHPASRAPRTMTNNVTNAVNYLFHFIDKRKFWTVFTARDPSGVFHHLGHVAWSLHFDFQFTWRHGSPKARNNGSQFSAGEFVQHAPTYGKLQSLLNHPVPPHANESVRNALKRTVLNGKPNRSDNGQRIFNNLPHDFFV